MCPVNRSGTGYLWYGPHIMTAINAVPNVAIGKSVRGLRMLDLYLKRRRID